MTGSTDDQKPVSATDTDLMRPIGAPHGWDGGIVQQIAWHDPHRLFQQLADAPGIAFLDSAASADPRGRYSYIGIDPHDAVIVEDPSDPILFDRLRTLAARLPRRQSSPSLSPSPLPFTAGIIGMLSYDAGRERLNVATRHAPDGAPALVARAYDFVIGFDHQDRHAYACIGHRPERNADQRFADWRARVATAVAQPVLVPLQWTEQCGAAAHAEKLAMIANYLRAGDIYQANFSTRFSAARPAGFDPAGTYMALRAASPNPFGAYLDLGSGRMLLSASPERFVQLDACGRIETRPIKGTAPRHADPAADADAAARLRASAKDWSENLMICDLLRNDLAMLSVPGSVKVTQLAGLERFASVWHLVSAITAQLRPGTDAIDLLAQISPGGSITGAPKRRAAQIIDALEESRRGAMFGSVFYIGADGALDSSIIIRSMMVGQDQIVASAGGGIVIESDPAAEYAELHSKIDPLLKATGISA